MRSNSLHFAADHDISVAASMWQECGFESGPYKRPDCPHAARARFASDAARLTPLAVAARFAWCRYRYCHRTKRQIVTPDTASAAVACNNQVTLGSMRCSGAVQHVRRMIVSTFADTASDRSALRMYGVGTIQPPMRAAQQWAAFFITPVLRCFTFARHFNNRSAGGAISVTRSRTSGLLESGAMLISRGSSRAVQA